MISVVCRKKCFYRGHLYKPGETRKVKPGDILNPNHWDVAEGMFNYKELPRCTGSVTLMGRGPSAVGAKLIGKVAILNWSGFDWDGDADFWLTLHGDRMGEWIKKRGKTDLTVIIPQMTMDFDYCYAPDIKKSGGGSALYAMEVLATMGFDHIHCVGIDLTDMDRPEGNYADFRKAFRQASFPGIRVTAIGGLAELDIPYIEKAPNR